jgi:multimeric flavodoxin WrbA
MKIIGVCGSPRKGNTEWMLRTLLEAAGRSEAEVELLLLRKMDVRMCRGCLACEEGGKERRGICKIKDDMNAVYPKLLAADAIVLATPGYMELISGLLKNFLDRTCAVCRGWKARKSPVWRWPKKASASRFRISRPMLRS